MRIRNHTALGWIILVTILLSIIVLQIKEVHDNRFKSYPSADMTKCQSEYELLVTHSNFIKVETTVNSYNGSTSYPIFKLTSQSRDRNFHKTLESKNLCDIISESWDKMNVYDAYMDEKKNKQ